MAEAIVFRTTVASDIILALIGLGTATACGFVLATGGYFDVAREMGSPPWMNLTIWVVVVLVILDFMAMGVGGAWRLIDRRPALEADAAGVRLHPSLHASPVAWSRLRAVGFAQSSLVLEFESRFWSAATWATGRRVKLTQAALNLKPDVAQAGVTRMRQWLEAGKAG